MTHQVAGCVRYGSLIVFVVAMLAGANRLAAQPSTDVPASPSFSTESLRFFENEVRPILIARCITCHNDQKQEGGLNLNRRETVMQGGDSGPAVATGDPQASRLSRAVHRGEDLQMPPDEGLSAREIQVIDTWIEQHLPWPPGQALQGNTPKLRSGAPTDAERQHWAFQPIRHPQAPPLRSTWPQNALDRFVLAAMQPLALSPSSPADRRTWLRRVTLDLTGLPPTWEELCAYEHDPRADADERVVDRLLSSPAYGERWGRHWLDVVRYADTAGETGDYPTPLAYKYRNWVVAALNRDEPYDEFLREQIAGDLIAAALPNDDSPATVARTRELLTATGFIAISRRFGFDVENYHYLTIQDTIDTLGQAVMGLSLGCARCHDHKYDPISSQDFYAWYGIFASTRYSFPGSEEKKRPYDLFAVSMTDGRVEALTSESSPRADLIYGAIDGAQPGNARQQLRGEPSKPGDEIPRRNLELLGGEPLQDAHQSGRLELAHWLTRRENPLTARVMVNRLWQQHFGVGLVASENDFGVRGQAPSHADLLDWLATQLIESGWSLKSMQRLIVTSATYRQQCVDDEARIASDVENRWLTRFPRRRLTAEELRDAMLMVSDSLDRALGLAHPFPDVATWGFTQHSPFYADYPSRQRSIYLMQQRLKRHAYLSLFDGADPNSTTGHRQLTTVPTQSLFLMNSSFVHACSQQIAQQLLPTARIMAPPSSGETYDSRPSVGRPGPWAAPSSIDATTDDSTNVGNLFQRVLGRRPADAECQAALQFLSTYRDELARAGIADTKAQQALSWAALARTKLICNEFLFVE